MKNLLHFILISLLISSCFEDKEDHIKFVKEQIVQFEGLTNEPIALTNLGFHNFSPNENYYFSYSNENVQPSLIQNQTQLDSLFQVVHFDSLKSVSFNFENSNYLFVFLMLNSPAHFYSYDNYFYEKKILNLEYSFFYNSGLIVPGVVVFTANILEIK